MLFSKKPKMLTIQINDEKINKDICRLIFHAEKHVTNLKNILETNAPGDRDTEMEDIYNAFLRIHQDIDIVARDIRQIVNIELQRKEYIILDDKSFLNDKMLQMEKIRQHINNVIAILETRPRDQELKQDLLSTIILDINTIIDGLNNIIADDETLEKLYVGLNKPKKQAA